MSLTEEDLRSSSRHALRVRRYHTWPMIQEQCTDAHSLQMMRIWWCCWGPLPPEVSTAILWHDAGEGDAGDAQFGAKRRYPALKAALDDCERAALSLLLNTDAPGWSGRGWAGELTESQCLRVKAVDLIEGLEHALVDVATGNRLAGPVVHAYASAWVAHAAKMSADDVMPLADVYLRRPLHQKMWYIYEETCL